jgi:hypothetical protein
MFSRSYWLDLAERIAASFAGGVLSALGGDVVDLWNLDWRAVLGLGAGAALVSLLKGLVARGSGDRESASLVGALPPSSARHREPG